MSMASSVVSASFISLPGSSPIVASRAGALFWPTRSSLSIQAIIGPTGQTRRFAHARTGQVARAGAQLKLRPAAEPELLDDVVTLFGKRDRVVEPQRTERRVPDQAGADRGTEVPRAGIGELDRLAEELREHRRAGVVPHVADVGERGNPQADVLGQVRDRGLQFRRG